MIGLNTSMSLSVLSAQQLQAQRDAQTARAKADRLQNQSQQAMEEARQATERSEGLSRQSQSYNREADRAQQQANATPQTQAVEAPAPQGNTAPTPADDPLPRKPLKTGQQIGRQILTQDTSATQSFAVQAYQRVQSQTYVSVSGGAGALSIAV